MKITKIVFQHWSLFNKFKSNSFSDNLCVSGDSTKSGLMMVDPEPIRR